MSAATTPSRASTYYPYLGQFEEPKMRGDRQVAVSTLAEEPAALIGHGGVCEGGRFWRRQPPTFLYSEALEPLQHSPGRRRHLSPVRHRAHVSPVPQDGQGDRHRGPAAQGLSLGRSGAEVAPRTVG